MKSSTISSDDQSETECDEKMSFPYLKQDLSEKTFNGSFAFLSWFLAEQQI